MGCKKWDINREWTGAILHGRPSPAVCTGVNTAMQGGLRSGLAGVGGSTCRRIQAGMEMLAKES